MNLGESIKKQVKAKRIRVTDFAKMLNCSRGNVYKIFDKDTVDIEQLKRICRILSYNFFEDLAIQVREEQKRGFDCDGTKDGYYQYFFDNVPKILDRFDEVTTFVMLDKKVFSKERDVVPDIGLSDYPITFTFGDKMRDRIGNESILPINEEQEKNGQKVEVIQNVVLGSVFVNISVIERSEEEWHSVLSLAFKLCKERNYKLPK